MYSKLFLAYGKWVGIKMAQYIQCFNTYLSAFSVVDLFFFWNKLILNIIIDALLPDKNFKNSGIFCYGFPA